MRFMGGKPANLNSVIENQDSDANLQLAFWDITDTIHALRVQIQDTWRSDGCPAVHLYPPAAQAVVPCFKRRPDREGIAEPFLLRIFRKRRRERRENVSRNRR